MVICKHRTVQAITESGVRMLDNCVPVVDSDSPTGFSWVHSVDSCCDSCDACPDGAADVAASDYRNQSSDSDAIDYSMNCEGVMDYGDM